MIIIIACFSVEPCLCDKRGTLTSRAVVMTRTYSYDVGGSVVQHVSTIGSKAEINNEHKCKHMPFIKYLPILKILFFLEDSAENMQKVFISYPNTRKPSLQCSL